jgi:pimeloyl-ACP methyl ester carboxylesterase
MSKRVFFQNLFIYLLPILLIVKNAGPIEIIRKAGHMIQEDAGEEVANRILEWIRAEDLVA